MSTPVALSLGTEVKMMPIRRRLMAAVTALFLYSSLAAAATDDHARRARVPVPANISMDRLLREQLEVTAAASETLRRQFATIGAAIVQVELCVSPAPLPGFRRAETSMGRYSGGLLRAVVAVPPGPDFVELLAHELEHIIEQIEGVDLAALVRAGRASRDGQGVYETDRAHAVGRTAAQEVERAFRP